MGAETLNKDEKKETWKEKSEGDKAVKREYKPSPKLEAIRAEEKEDKKKEGNPEDILNKLNYNNENPLANLNFYKSKETTPTGKQNEWAKNMQGMSQADISKIIVDNNLDASSNKAFQANIYDKLLASADWQKTLLKMRSEYGNTNLGESSNLQKVVDDIRAWKNVPVQLLKDLRTAFVDGDLGARTVYLLTLIGKTKIPPPDIEKPRQKNPWELLKTMFNKMRFDENTFITNQFSNVSVWDVTYMRGNNTDKMGMPDGVIMLDTRGNNQNERNDIAMIKRITDLWLKPGVKYLIPYRVQNETTTTTNFTAVIEKAKQEGSITEVPQTMDQATLEKTLAEMNAKMK